MLHPRFLVFSAVLAFFSLSSTQAGDLRVGAAQVDISPPKGAPLAGYYKFRAMEGVLDPLYAKTMVIEQDGAKVAFVVVDLSTVSRPVVTEARKLITEKTGIPPERVMISATHTHSGPQLPRGSLMDKITKVDTPDGQAFSVSLPALIAQSVQEASSKLAPARGSATKALAEGISFNRRVIDKDGKCIWQPRKIDPATQRPAGPVDPELGLMVFEPLRGGDGSAPLAAYVNFAMHPTSVGAGTRISADYPGVLTKLLRERKGESMVAIFANGTCGNINHTNYLTEVKRPAGMTETHRLGLALADVATQAWPERKPFATYAPRARSETLTLPRRKFSEVDIAKAKDVVSRMMTESLGTVLMAEAVCVIETVEKEKANVPLLADVQVISFSNDVAMVALPGEIFVELGLAIKVASPFKHTFIAELANGSIGYVPNREAYPQGNYEVVSARCAAGSGEMLVETAIKLLKAVREAKE